MQVEEALGFLHSAGLSEAAKFAAGTVLCCVDEAQKITPALEREAEVVLLRVAEAWQKLVSLPPGAARFSCHHLQASCHRYPLELPEYGEAASRRSQQAAHFRPILSTIWGTGWRMHVSWSLAHCLRSQLQWRSYWGQRSRPLNSPARSMWRRMMPLWRPLPTPAPWRLLLMS